MRFDRISRGFSPVLIFAAQRGLTERAFMADPSKTTSCPKCGRRLQASGELIIEGESVPTFQCDECLRVVEFLGQRQELALTFCLDAAGRAFDPADPEADLSR